MPIYGKSYLLLMAKKLVVKHIYKILLPPGEEGDVETALLKNRQVFICQIKSNITILQPACVIIVN
jgi:hypothetical protein